MIILCILYTQTLVYLYVLARICIGCFIEYTQQESMKKKKVPPPQTHTQITANVIH